MIHRDDVATALAAAKHLAGSCVAIIGAPVRSVILHGSLATGDFIPGRSDIDLLVIVDGTLPDEHVAALEDLVRRADPGGASGIDLHVVTEDVAGTPARVPPMELHVGRYDSLSIGVEVESRVAAAPDLPAELSMARADGRALVGVAPTDAIAPVPAEWIRERGRHWLTTWQSPTHDAAGAEDAEKVEDAEKAEDAEDAVDAEDAMHMVLTACRIWRYAVEGVHSAKVSAAGWALHRDPSLTAVRQAVHRYTTDPTAPIGAAGIARVLDTVLRDTAQVR
ncbi:nucleotidyltransferase domain-containing protein [Plantactinospora soyae]|uniref:Nucleotidyltransferase n=1 Tax=Plantactinospora soyae TaxID=1544732 RepID=A0A927MG79_9ACTN|nr:aminoglycoside adenylyltransferase domain-containing protein [Plantactinospora soyae]MBE1492461.1 putative nucleotidyltransferase [Plantactinospora soyae]